MKTQRRFEVMGEDIRKVIEKLQSNQKLLKLLKFSDNHPLSHPDLTQDEIDDMINKNLLIVPKLPDQDPLKDSFVVAVLDSYEVSPNADFKNAVLRFQVVCPLDRWIINGTSLRPYLILNEIDKMFNEQKLAGIGNLSFIKCENDIYSGYIGGYTVYYGHYEFN